MVQFFFDFFHIYFLKKILQMFKKACSSPIMYHTLTDLKFAII